MKLAELTAHLESFCPVSFAQDWDNVGLMCGRSDSEIRLVMLALDATGSVIEQAVEAGADLLLTHHPLLFRATKHVTDDDFVGRRILTLAEHHIACYAMHTNFDVLGMADAAADELKLLDREVLEVTFEDDVSREGLGRVGKLPACMTLEEVAQYVKDVFHIRTVRVYGNPEEPVVTAAVLPGAGGSEIDLAVRAGADVMITGDISHHTGIDAAEKGIAVIDAGHYGVEKLFLPHMEEFFRRELPALRVICANEAEPFLEI